MPPELDALVLDSLQRDPSLRPQSAARFALRLEQVSAKLGIGATESTLANWMTTLFGAERAKEKLRAAQSGPRDDIHQEVATLIRDLSRPLTTQPAPRVAWSTDAAGGSAVANAADRAEYIEVGRHHSFVPLSPASPESVFRSEEHHLVPPLVERSATSDLSNPFMTPKPTRPPFAKAALVAFGIVLSGAALGWALVNDASPPVKPADTAPVVWVTSAPEGGRVYVDGEPTGMVTPARLTGVVPSTMLRIRVDFPNGGQ